MCFDTFMSEAKIWILFFCAIKLNKNWVRHKFLNELLQRVDSWWWICSGLAHRGCSLLEVEGALSQRQRLTAEVSALGEEEQRLEQLIQRCTQDMRHMSELPINQKYPFVSVDWMLSLIDWLVVSLNLDFFLAFQTNSCFLYWLAWENWHFYWERSTFSCQLLVFCFFF